MKSEVEQRAGVTQPKINGRKGGMKEGIRCIERASGDIYTMGCNRDEKHDDDDDDDEVEEEEEEERDVEEEEYDDDEEEDDEVEEHEGELMMSRTMQNKKVRNGKVF